MTLQAGDPDYDAKYLAELKALVARQGEVIVKLTATQDQHNEINRACLAQRDAARAELAKVTTERDAARTMLANAELRIMRIERDMAGMERQAVDTSIVAEAIITGPAIPTDARLETALIDALEIAERALDAYVEWWMTAGNDGIWPGVADVKRLREIRKLVGS